MKISDDIKYQNWRTGREVAQCSSHLCFCNYFSRTHYFHPAYLLFPNILFYQCAVRDPQFCNIITAVGCGTAFVLFTISGAVAHARVARPVSVTFTS